MARHILIKFYQLLSASEDLVLPALVADILVPLLIPMRTQLTDLGIQSNSLSGPLTDEVNNLVYFKTLSTSNNNLDGHIPSFDRLTNLEILGVGSLLIYHRIL